MGYDMKEKIHSFKVALTKENCYGLAELTFDEQHLANCLKTILSRKVHKFKGRICKNGIDCAELTFDEQHLANFFNIIFYCGFLFIYFFRVRDTTGRNLPLLGDATASRSERDDHPGHDRPLRSQVCGRSLAETEGGDRCRR